MPDEQQQGLDALEAIKEPMSAFAVAKGEPRPNYRVDVALEKLPALMAMIDGAGDPLMANVPEVARGKIAEIRGRSEVLVRALRFSRSQDQRLDTPTEGQLKTIQALVAEGAPLRKAGFAALRIMTALNVTTVEEERKIRRGRGTLDKAGDLQSVGHLCKENWGWLGPLQAAQRDEALRLSVGDPDRMIKLGDAIMAHDKSSKGGARWRLAHIQAHALLESDWDYARRWLKNAFIELGRPADADKLVSLRALANS